MGARECVLTVPFTTVREMCAQGAFQEARTA